MRGFRERGVTAARVSGPSPGMPQKGRGLRGGPRGGWTGGWRRLPQRLGAVTVGYKCHLGWCLASGGQWLGIGWAPWGGGGSPPSNASLSLPLIPPPTGARATATGSTPSPRRGPNGTRPTDHDGRLRGMRRVHGPVQVGMWGKQRRCGRWCEPQQPVRGSRGAHTIRPASLGDRSYRTSTHRPFVTEPIPLEPCSAVESGDGQGCIGSPPPPFQGAQPMPSHCPPDAKCQPQWHL